MIDYLVKSFIWILMVLILTPYFLILPEDEMKLSMDKLLIWLHDNGWFDK